MAKHVRITKSNTTDFVGYGVSELEDANWRSKQQDLWVWTKSRDRDGKTKSYDGRMNVIKGTNNMIIEHSPDVLKEAEQHPYGVISLQLH